jgi:5-formyltetrahydrofolate cyclo-ligase
LPDSIKVVLGAKIERDYLMRFDMTLEVSSESAAKTKIAIRKMIVQKREELGGLEKEEKNTAIAQRLFGMDEFKKSKTVFCFLSTSFEVQTERIIRESLRLGKQVLVPLLDPGGENLKASRIPSMDIDFVIGEYGVRQPAPKFRNIVPFANIDFVVVPGLAFDNFGNRIGYGGGFYDKFFKKITRDVSRVAVSYDFQLFNLVPHSHSDEPVHFLITETKALRCHDKSGVEV